jgi:hypothetical protein
LVSCESPCRPIRDADHSAARQREESVAQGVMHDFQRTPSRLTRRQSQRPARSRLVLSYVKPNVTVGPINLFLHESRPSGSWLIFDVGQKFRHSVSMPRSGSKRGVGLAIAGGRTLATRSLSTGSIPRSHVIEIGALIADDGSTAEKQDTYSAKSARL